MTMKNEEVVTRRSIELIKYCDYYGITSVGQLIETLVYFPQKYKTFYIDKGKEVYDTPDIQGDKLKTWYNLIVNKQGFVDIIDKYLAYKRQEITS